MRSRITGAWLVAGSAILFTALPAAAQIEVQVNGNPVQFGAVQPARVQGRVLIPLRAVVESLGAEVKWNGATQTVRGSKGSQEFELQINSRDAQVNGKLVSLEVPAQMMNGTTMVPLRFVAEALGADVQWNAATQQVVINSAGETNEPPPSAGGRRVQGEVVNVRNNRIIVRVDGMRQTYDVTPSTIILRGPEGTRGARAELEDIQPGDQVRIRVNPNTATALRIDANTAAGEEPPVDPPVADGNVEGEVLALRQRGETRTLIIRTAEGRRVFQISEDARVVRRGPRGGFTNIELDTIRAGDRVRLRTEGNTATRVESLARE